MKKILFASLALVAGLMMASCQQEHVDVVYDPSVVTDQTLQSIQGVELTSDGPDVTTTFNPADFKLDVAVLYNLYASASEDMADKAKMTSTITLNEEGTQGTISMAQKDINSMVYNLGGVAETPFTLYFQLGAAIASDKNAVIASTERFSNVVGATFTPYSTTIKDVDLFEHVWVIGGSSMLGGWKHEKVFQFLYDYEKTGNTFTGLIDMGEEHSENQFKLTGAANWDAATDWGIADGQEEKEPATVQLEQQKGNITLYTAKRFYFFSFNNTSLVLTKSYSFDNVGIVGGFNSWNEKDANLKMTYNPYFHRFWIDYSFADATELKFTCDDSWDLNWGEDCKPGAGNIAVAAGNYRIYLDLNKGEYEFSTSMFGKDEPTGDENTTPEPAFEGWSVTGSIAASGINWDGDLDMTQAGEFWSVKNVTLAASDAFKFRKAHDWADNIGAAGDVEPFVVAVGQSYEGAAGGKNLAVPADGAYDLYVNPDTKVFYVMNNGDVPEELATWGLVGSNINNWGETPDLVMELENGLLVRKNVTLTTGSQFKIRYQNNWDVNRGAPGSVEPYVMSADKGVRATAGGKNLGVAEDGSYDVWYDETNEILYVVKAGEALPQTWGVVGDFTSWGGNPDRVMVEENGMLVARNIDLLASNQYKVRFNSDWDVNRGAPGEVEPFTVTLGEALQAVQGGKNMAVPEDGSFDVYYDQTNEVLYTVKAGEKPNTGEPEPVDTWGLCGDFNGWNADVAMTEKDGVFTGFVVIGYKEDNTVQKFKIRKNGAWDVSAGGTLVSLDTPFEAVTADGPDIVVPEIGAYKVVYDTTANTITVSKIQGWSVIGAVAGSSWDKDFVMTYDGGSKWVSEALEMTAESKFKVRFNSSWADADTRGAAADFALTIGEAFKAVSPGSDIAVPAAGTYTVTYDSAAEEITVAAAGGEPVGGSIKTAAELLAFLANPAAEAELDADIDISGETFIPADFKGVFDGKGHTVTYTLNVAKDATFKGGLFNSIDGTVKNLKVAGSITTEGIAAGGIAGYTAENAIIENCENSVNILDNAYGTAAAQLGGIVADAATGVQITGCVNKGKVEFLMPNKSDDGRANQLGGIAGRLLGTAVLKDCTNEGQITYSAKGTTRMGGMVGYISDPIDMLFDGCVNNGLILADITNKASGYQYIGGLTGYVATNTKVDGKEVAVDGVKVRLANCINNGEVKVLGNSGNKGNTRIGGVASYVGATDAKMKAASLENSNNLYEFKGCVNNGEVSTDGDKGTNQIGGILGFGESIAKCVFEDCTSNGNLSVGGTGVLGGILGANGGTASSFTGVKVTSKCKFTVAGAGVMGILVANNAAYTTPIKIGLRVACTRFGARLYERRPR